MIFFETRCITRSLHILVNVCVNGICTLLVLFLTLCGLTGQKTDRGGLESAHPYFLILLDTTSLQILQPWSTCWTVALPNVVHSWLLHNGLQLNLNKFGLWSFVSRLASRWNSWMMMTCLCDVSEYLRLVDSRLFNRIQSPSHCLSHLLPPEKHHLGHSYIISICPNKLCKSSFIPRCLFCFLWLLTVFSTTVFTVYHNICICHLF